MIRLDIKTSLIALSVILISGCATMRAPTGGPKDVTPPATIENGIIPENRSTRMTSKTIALTFDEYIKLNNPTQQVIISPPMETPPEFEIRKKTLYVTFTDSLKPNTTYTMNFGNAIQDITEGNSSALNYVFSTGSYLDSLTFDGQVIDALTLEPASGMKVMLYDPARHAYPDSLPLLEKPFYFTSTDKNGRFHFENLKGGSFKLFALQDENNNYIYDPGEQIAFSERPVVVSQDSSQGLTIKSFTEASRLQFVEKDGYEEPGMFYVQFKNEPINPEFSTIPGGIIKAQEQVGDSLVFWMDTSLVKDSVILNLSVDGLDSLQFVHYERTKDKVPRKIRPSLVKKTLTPADTITLKFDYPILSVDGRSVFIMDSDSTVHSTEVLYEPWNREVKILTSADSLKGRAMLIMDRRAVVTTYAGFNDSLSIPVQFLKEDEYGTLRMNLIGLDSLSENLILHVMDESGRLIKTIVDPERVQTFKYMLPGKYKARMILDKNGNRKWDPGVYLDGQRPESVLYFNEAVSLRGGWDIDVDWQVTRSPR